MYNHEFEKQTYQRSNWGDNPPIRENDFRLKVTHFIFFGAQSTEKVEKMSKMTHLEILGILVKRIYFRKSERFHCIKLDAYA